MEIVIIFFIVPLGLVIFAIIYSKIHKTTGERIKKNDYKKQTFTTAINHDAYLKNLDSKIKSNQKNSINNWIFIFPIIFFILTVMIKNIYHEKNEPNKQVPQIDQPVQNINQNPTPQENSQMIYKVQMLDEEKYMKDNHLIKLGDKYAYCGIKESKEILPVTKALDIGCQNDLCRITKYYDYVKQIPYEKGTHGKDKNAIDVMQEWKGDCDERSDLLGSMMLANGYKVILLYTNSHALTALNIPNYESNDNRSYVQYQGQKYYIAETTDPKGQIGAYNDEVMHSIKYIYAINEKRVVSSQEVHIQLYK